MRGEPRELLDPGIHEPDPGEERVTVVTVPDPNETAEERVMHLVQDEETIAELQQLVLPPDEYYEELAKLWKEWWPRADPLLLDHMMS